MTILDDVTCAGCDRKQGDNGYMLMMVGDMFLCCDCLNKAKEKQAKYLRELITG